MLKLITVLLLLTIHIATGKENVASECAQIKIHTCGSRLKLQPFNFSEAVDWCEISLPP